MSSLHAFPYSKRPNTAALRMPNHIPTDVIQQRVRTLRALSANLYRQFANRFVGQSMEILWEGSEDSQGRIVGKTRNYVEVVAKTSAEIRPGSITNCKMHGFVEKDRVFCS